MKFLLFFFFFFLQVVMMRPYQKQEFLSKSIIESNEYVCLFVCLYIYFKISVPWVAWFPLQDSEPFPTNSLTTTQLLSLLMDVNSQLMHPHKCICLRLVLRIFYLLFHTNIWFQSCALGFTYRTIHT